MSKVICFYHEYDEYGFFSNWYRSDFSIDGKTFSSVEQYMMYNKAMMFGAEELAAKIMATDDPATIKKLGRSYIKNFNAEQWDSFSYDVVKKGIYAKFEQNEILKETLLNTGNMVLAEASLNDRRWGIGIADNDEARYNMSKWRGKNLLGKALMEVRAELTGQTYKKKETVMRYREDEIAMLQDTLNVFRPSFFKFKNRKIKLKLTNEELTKSRVYLPDRIMNIAEKGDFLCSISKERCEFGCENRDSFSLAKERLQTHSHLFNDKKTVLVLNLANPVNPGGGVRRGARAQEEDLCRKSSLLLALEHSDAEKYYNYNRSLHTKMGSDAVIITPNVEVIKDEWGELLEESIIVSVMTCAAPMIWDGLEGLSQEEYQALIYNRITAMLTVAAYEGYEVLVLGAFGCGAFGNDSELVSDLFYKAFKEFKLQQRPIADYFKRVDFAVLSRGRKQYNFKQFSRNFADYYKEKV